MGGRITVESVVRCSWNGWPDDRGIRRIVAFSSNYALYGDLSQRVMTVIDSLVVNSTAYSIDEAFCDLGGMTLPLERLGRQIRSKVLRYTGIPVGVGIAGTKTLAKLANHAAKRWQRQTGGVVDITDSVRRDKLLKVCDVSDVWCGFHAIRTLSPR
ncbi:hypothetical protein GIW79_29330 [Pseudomonas sp. PA-7-1E]|nr:hypothetical protein [Pseudomonas sp. PA-7-1E]